MKIKDFNDHVRIGSEIRFRGVIRTVYDIDRREHTMRLCQNGSNNWVRCSEVDFVKQAEAHTDNHKWVTV